MDYYDMMNPLHFDQCVVDFGGKVLLLGANEQSEAFLEEEGKAFDVVGIVDRKKQKWGSFLTGRTVLSPKRLLNKDAVVLVMESDFMGVAEQLNWMGVEPYFHWKSIKLIREDGSDNRDIESAEAAELFKQSSFNLSYEGWLDKKRYTHAMGTVDGIRFTNSLEAFHQCYAQGIRAFECDLARDQSGVFYLCHGRAPMWTIFKSGGAGFRPLMDNIYNEVDEIGFPTSFEKFKEEKIYGRYTPLRLEELVELTKEYPDISIIIDVKRSTSMQDVFQAIVSLDNSLFRKIMLSCTVATLEEFSHAKGNENINAILLREGDIDGDLPDQRSTHNQLIRTCLRNGIKIIQVAESRVNRGFVELAERNGIRLCLPLMDVSVGAKERRFSNMGVSIFEMRGL